MERMLAQLWRIDRLSGELLEDFFAHAQVHHRDLKVLVLRLHRRRLYASARRAVIQASPHFHS
jgi:hypothetical protein